MLHLRHSPKQSRNAGLRRPHRGDAGCRVTTSETAFFANSSSALDLISSAAKIGFEQLFSEQTKAADLSSGGYSTSACGNGPSRSSHHSIRLYPEGIRSVARKRGSAAGSSLCPTTVRWSGECVNS